MKRAASNLPTLCKRAGISIIMLLVAGACTRSDEIKLPEKLDKLSSERDGSDDEDDTCLALRSGTVVNDENREPFRHVGVIGPVDPNNPDAPIRAKCSGTLIRPDVAIASQLNCVTQLDLTNSSDQDQLVFSLNSSDPSQNRAIKQIVRWRESEPMFRDVSLIVLEEPVGDETFLPYQIKQGAIADDATFEVTLAGNGAYTNGADGTTFSEDGALRFGKATLNGNARVTIGDLRTSDYDVTTAIDYLRVDSLNGAAIGCLGNRSSDLGSPAFQTTPAINWLIGMNGGNNGAGVIRAMNGNNDDPADDVIQDTDANRCAVATLSAYVSTASVGDWIRSRLAAINPQEVVMRRTLAKAKVKEIEEGDKADTLALELVEVYDDGLGLDGSEHSVSLCKTGCLPQARVIGKVDKDAELLFELSREGDELQVSSVQPIDLGRKYPVVFDATVFLRDDDSRSVYGRVERTVRLSYVTPLQDSLPVPVYHDKARGIECGEGCSIATTISTEGFALVPEVGVRVKGEVIDGRLYLREIAKNAEFDADKVRARLQEAADSDDSDPAEEGGSSGNSKKKKKSCSAQ